VVALARECKVTWKHEVRVFSLSDNSWRDISIPLISVSSMNNYTDQNNGVHLNGTINWLAIAISKQFVIISHDLSTETNTQILFPSSLDEVLSNYQPTLRVLMDCLCFSYDCNVSECVIWQMMEFGVQESWTQLFRIDYCKIDRDMKLFGIPNSRTRLLPLYLSKDGDTLIFVKSVDDPTIIYNRRDKRVETIKTSNRLCWFYAMDYVESLVSTY
jgi:F-box interacting protein